MNLGTWLFTRLKGRLVGADAYGNAYYEERRPRTGYRVRRWVTYPGPPEASRVPPEWHAWLHYTTDAPLVERPRWPWEKPHQPNLTGTPLAYHPPGSVLRGGHRPPATGDYEPWIPE